MRTLLLLFGFLAALAIGCGQSEATPLPQTEVAESAPPVKVDPIKPAIEAAPVAAGKATQKSAALPAAFAPDDKKPETVREEPTLPKDKGSKLVESFLRPPDAALPLFRTRPRRLRAAPFLEKPALPTTQFQGNPLRMVTKLSGKPIRPHAVPEDVPLYGKRTSPRLPGDIQLPAAALVQWPSPNADELPSLPTLAQQQPDRASLADPTGEASTAVALEAAIPLRTSPAPFVRVNLPDPFEHRETVRLRTPPPEDPTPAN
jgi:hypothetical protein